jgi:hypothetical protein
VRGPLRRAKHSYRVRVVRVETRVMVIVVAMVITLEQ